VDELYISGRERKIVEVLLAAEQAFTIKQIAAELEVSERTIHRDLKNVEEILYDHHLQLNRKTGAGLYISGQETDKHNLQLILSNVKHTDFTPEERQAMMLLTLLEANEPIKLFTLANELHVTIATVSNDLDKVEEALQKFRLILERRQGYGVKIEGNEADKRSAISYLFTKHVDEFAFITLLKENIQKRSQRSVQTISNRLLGLVHPDKLQTIEREVEKIRDELPYDLADSAYIGLVVHLALAIERLQKGDNIQFDPDYLEQMKETNEYNVAAALIKRLEKALHMPMPEDEIGYITMHLMGAKLRIDHDYLIEDSNLDVAYKAKKLIQYVSTHLNRDLTTHTQLLHDLVAHLKPAVYRLKQKMGIKNPMIEQIKHNYPELFELIKRGVSETFPEITFPDEEIGYLVLHFGSVLLQNETEISLKALVVCSSGIGTAKMLATKLQKQIPEIRQVENKSLFDLEQTDLEAYDLIVSTIPLKGIEKDYIIATPMLEQTAVQKIEKTVRRKKISQPVLKKKEQQQMQLNRKLAETEDIIARLRAKQQYSKAILSVLDSFYVEHIEHKQTVEEIMFHACKTLKYKQVIDNNQAVFEQLLEREKMGGLAIPGSTIALYHTRSHDVNSFSFSIYALSHPVEVQGMDGKMKDVKHILVMLAPQETEPEALEIMSCLSGLIIQNEASIELFQSAKEADIKSFLTEQLNQYMEQKLAK